MKIFAMAFGAAKEGDGGKREVHFRAAFTKTAKDYEGAKRFARLQLNTYYPLDQGWEQHTIDVHEIPLSWCIEVARSDLNSQDILHEQD